MGKWDNYEMPVEFIAAADQYEQTYRDSLKRGIDGLVADKVADAEMPVAVQFTELYEFIVTHSEPSMVIQNVCFWLVTAMDMLANYQLAGQQMFSTDEDGTLMAAIQKHLGMDSLADLDFDIEQES